MFSRHIGYTVTVYRSMIFPSQFVSVNGHWYSIISTYHINFVYSILLNGKQEFIDISLVQKWLMKPNLRLTCQRVI